MLGMWIVSAGGAAAAAPAPYTLSECVRAALDNSPDLIAASATLAKARAQLAEARAGRFGQSTYTQLFGLVNEAHGNPVFSSDDKNDVFDGLGPFTRLELDISIPLWTFGKLEAALEAAQRGLESELAHGQVKRAEVVLQVQQLYYSVLLTRQLSAVLHDMLDTLDKAVTKTQQRLDEGSHSTTETDLLKLKIGRAKLNKGVVEVDAAGRLALAALARAIGLEDGAPFEVAERKLEPTGVQLESLDAYLEQGLHQRPEWQQVASGVAARTAQVQLERANLYPSIFLSTGVHYAVAGNRTEQDNPFAYDDFNYIRPIGVLGLRWDLNFFTQQAKIDQAQADLAHVVAEQRAAASGLRLDIRRAYSDVMQHRETIQSAEQGRKAARGWLILGVSNFDLGIGEPDELFNALGAYSETSSDYFRAVHDYNVAVATLGKAVGRDLANLGYEE
jgi:HAE1 family hydrophobic/amphiphilic exporter-1